MSKNIELTLACGDYEIIRPLKEGRVKPDGIDLTFLTAMDLTTRHWRFLRGQEFDAAEVSCSSFIVARDQGFVTTAIPVAKFSQRGRGARKMVCSAAACRTVQFSWEIR